MESTNRNVEELVLLVQDMESRINNLEVALGQLFNEVDKKANKTNIDDMVSEILLNRKRS